MEDWEKKFAELEAEVDAEFERAQARGAGSPSGKAPGETASRGDEASASSGGDGEGFLDGIERKAARKALEKAAERSLTGLSPRSAVVWSVAALLGLYLLMANLGKIIFFSAIVGGLWYFLVKKHEDEAEDEEAGTEDEDPD